MSKHELKTWPDPFTAIIEGRKRHELRVNDRNYQVGDTLLLREFYSASSAYSGRSVEVKVTYITEGGQWGLPKNLCVMSIERLPMVCKSCGHPQDKHPFRHVFVPQDFK